MEFKDEIKGKTRKPDKTRYSPTLEDKDRISPVNIRRKPVSAGENLFRPENPNYSGDTTRLLSGEAALIGLLPTPTLPEDYKRRGIKLESSVALVQASWLDLRVMLPLKAFELYRFTV